MYQTLSLWYYNTSGRFTFNINATSTPTPKNGIRVQSHAFGSIGVLAWGGRSGQHLGSAERVNQTFPKFAPASPPDVLFKIPLAVRCKPMPRVDLFPVTLSATSCSGTVCLEHSHKRGVSFRSAPSEGHQDEPESDLQLINFGINV